MALLPLSRFCLSFPVNERAFAFFDGVYWYRRLLCVRQSGHGAAPPRSVMNSRRLIAPPRPGSRIVAGQTGRLEVVGLALGNVRFGSKADISECPTVVRFTPKADI